MWYLYMLKTKIKIKNRQLLFKAVILRNSAFAITLQDQLNTNTWNPIWIILIMKDIMPSLNLSMQFRIVMVISTWTDVQMEQQ